jgi:hypothetical protein
MSATGRQPTVLAPLLLMQNFLDVHRRPTGLVSRRCISCEFRIIFSHGKQLVAYLTTNLATKSNFVAIGWPSRSSAGRTTARCIAILQRLLCSVFDIVAAFTTQFVMRPVAPTSRATKAEPDCIPAPENTLLEIQRSPEIGTAPPLVLHTRRSGRTARGVQFIATFCGLELCAVA